MSITDFYMKDVSIERLSQVDDAYGGATNTWAASIASYDCRIYTPSGDSVIEGLGKIEGVLAVCVGANADILIGDKIVDGTDEYIVKNVYKVYAKSAIHHLNMSLDKIK